MAKDPLSARNLKHLYTRLNRRHFAGQLPPVPISLNEKLTRTAAQVIIDRDSRCRFRPNHIQVSPTVMGQVSHDRMLSGMRVSALEWLMLHEMTHVLLITVANECGHTPTFQAIMSSVTGKVCKHTYIPW